MRALWLLVLGCSVCAPAAAGLYKHVDEAGKVTYSDRPQKPQQEALRLPPPNVATPEARRQLEIARQASEREEQVEYEARVRRWAAVQRSPASYSRPLTHGAPNYASQAYYPYYYPSFNTYPSFNSYPSFNTVIAGTHAGSPHQVGSSEGLRASGVHHRAHHARR